MIWWIQHLTNIKYIDVQSCLSVILIDSLRTLTWYNLVYTTMFVQSTWGVSASLRSPSGVWPCSQTSEKLSDVEEVQIEVALFQNRASEGYTLYFATWNKQIVMYLEMHDRKIECLQENFNMNTIFLTICIAK